jgi:hypothetical protein
MCPQTPRLSPEYSHKAGLQIRPVMRSGHAGPVTMGRVAVGLRAGRGRKTGQPRHRSSSGDEWDEG